MSARDDSPPVSLFSFQDIITSITGIMFLVVLLLALIILDSSILKNSASEEKSFAAPPPAQDLTELKQKIALLDQLLKDSQKEYRTLSMQMEQELTLPPDKLDQKLAAEQELHTALKQKLRKTEHLTLSLKNENTLLEKESRRMAKSLQELDKKIQLEKTEISKRQQELEKQNKQLEKRKKLISYSVDSKFPKKLLIVECGPAGIRVKNTATGEVRSFIDPNDLTYASSITHFLQWAKQRDRQNEYFSLVITPGAFGYVNTLDQELTAAGFSRGKEILPSNDSRILEEEP